MAQLIPTTDVAVGGSGDFTNQPYVPQAKFSRTQTIYYPEQIQFNGEITGLRFFTAFSNTSTPPQPNTTKVFKIGHTTKEEFLPGDAFIPDSELTEIGITTYFDNAYEWIVVFDVPFVYNGTDNLVIDMEDIDPGISTSAIFGWRGTENFNNPPTRSLVSITEGFSDGSEQTSILLQNSFARTQFDGDLQVCMGLSVTDIENVTGSSADFTVTNIPQANHYRYVITEAGEPIPETYNITNNEQFTVTGLQPAQDYFIHVKTDCDAFGVTTGYRSYAFTTRPNTIMLPYTIDFEGAFNRDYNISSFGTEINSEAANLSSNGLMLNGPGYPGFLNWEDNGDPYDENRDFIRTLSIDVDLTQNAVAPVLKFDIAQNFESYLRVKIKDYADDSVFTGIPEDFIYNADNNDNDFKTVSYDLSEYVGELLTIKLEHVSSSNARKTYIDNIRLIENDCEKIENVTITNSETNSITVNWDATIDNNYEVVIAEFEDIVSTNYESVNTNAFTFSNLDVATSYKIFVRNKCASSDAPWQKIYASTDPNYLNLGYDERFDDTSLTNNFFSVLHSESSNVEVINYFLSEAFTLFQRDSKSEWVGGTGTTEAQAWNDNKDFMTGLKFIIDGATIESGEVDLTFKLYHYAVSQPEHSWFRILVNGNQVGPSYNPITKNSDTPTNVTIDLAPYVGSDIEFELQQVGRYLGDFSLSAISGDGTVLQNLAFTGAILSTNDPEMERLSLYPNPTKDLVTISGLSGMNDITLYDINGRVITTIKSSLPTTTIDVNSLESGLYFVNIESQLRQKKLKFIKN